MSEVELCGSFRTWAEDRGWIVHPEISDWDMVLVPGPGVVPDRDPLSGLMHSLAFVIGKSDQVGVQGKLLGNVDVLAQAARGRHTGPAWRLVLVPRPSDNFIELAGHLGIMVASPEVKVGRHGFARSLPAKWRLAADGFQIEGRALSVPITRQLDLPPVVTSLPAGAAAPRQLTKWRIKALRLCRILRAKGVLTPEDFKREKLDRRIWLDRWLDSCKDSGTVVYTARPGAELPDAGWEEVSAALAAKEDRDDQHEAPVPERREG